MQITDLSPTLANTSATDPNHSVSGRMLSIACAARRVSLVCRLVLKPLEINRRGRELDAINLATTASWPV